jgi:hypothetical protein
LALLHLVTLVILIPVIHDGDWNCLRSATMAKTVPPGAKRGKPDDQDGLFVLYPKNEEHHIEAEYATRQQTPSEI